MANGIDYSKFVKVKNMIYQSKYGEAHKLIKELLSDNPNYPELKFQEAVILGKNGYTYAESELILKDLLHTHLAGKANLELGRLYIKMEQYSRARECFLREVNGYLKPQAYEQLGRLELTLKHYDEAKTYFKKLMKTKFEDTAILEIAKIDAILGNTEKARNGFKMILKTTSGAYANIELGKLEKREGRYLLAEQYFFDAMNSNIKHIAIYELANLEIKRGNRKKAEEYYKKLLNYSNKADALIALSKISKNEFDFEKAELFLLEALSTKLSDRALVELGKLEMRKANYGKSIEYLSKVKRRKFKKLSVIYTMYNYIKIGDYLKAYQFLENAVVCKNITKFMDFKRVIEYKLGLLPKEELLSLNMYFYSQLASYSKERAIEHISLHLSENTSKRDHTLFNKDTDIEKLYDDSLKLISGISPKGINISEKYVVTLPYSVGVIDGKDTYTVSVVTLPNSKDIITIYPIVSIDTLDEEDALMEEEVDSMDLEKYRSDMLVNMEEVLNEIQNEGYNIIDSREVQNTIKDEIIKKLWHKM